jgi:2,6-dihydroxypyridine 3-monooxygenase
VHDQPCSYRFSSYSFLYNLLLGAFGQDRYNLGAEVVGFEQEGDSVHQSLASGSSDQCDLLVCADGIRSTARRLLMPEVKPRYAGYVAWRGTVRESQLTAATSTGLREAITYHVMTRSHVLAYPIPDPDGSLDASERLTNWVWYRNLPAGSPLDDLLTDRQGTRRDLSVPPGSVRQSHVEALRERACATLPPPLAEVVTQTSEPFVQAVFDIEVPRMVVGRVCLIGDAAFALRPHAAAGTAKAAEDAWTLGEAIIDSEGDVVEALRRWEPAQLRLGQRALERTRAAGDRSQFEAEWRTGDPLPFGLYETGDSALSTD